MKLKKILVIMSILCILLCIGSVAAADNDTAADDGNSDAVSEDTAVESDVSSGGENTTSDVPEVTAPPATVKKTDAYGLCSNAFIKKSNKYFTVKVCTFNEKKNKLEFHKNVKLVVKVKINGKTKTYKVTTGKNGEAKVLNVKNLKVGTYKVTVTSNDTKFNVKEKGFIGIFSKKTKSVTIKMGKSKKLRGDTFEAFFVTKNGQNNKGIYVNNYNTKTPFDGAPHCLILKAKLFLKNKKTGKTVTKTIKSKTSSIYGWEYPYSKLIKGYTPVKATIYYAYQ